MNTFLTWLAKLVLEWLFKKAVNAVEEKANEIRQAHERQETNENNVLAYEQAKDRKERIRAALDLINRTHRKP